MMKKFDKYFIGYILVFFDLELRGECYLIRNFLFELRELSKSYYW